MFHAKHGKVLSSIFDYLQLVDSFVKCFDSEDSSFKLNFIFQITIFAIVVIGHHYKA